MARGFIQLGELIMTRTKFFLLFVVILLVSLATVYGQRGQRGAQAGAQGAQPAQGPQGVVDPGGFGRGNTPTFPGPPAGMQALSKDMFTSKNFYTDKELWSDKRYFRCNTPRQITDIWTSRRIGT